MCEELVNFVKWQHITTHGRRIGVGKQTKMDYWLLDDRAYRKNDRGEICTYDPINWVGFSLLDIDTESWFEDYLNKRQGR